MPIQYMKFVAYSSLTTMSVNQSVNLSLTHSVYLSIDPPIHLRADTKDASSPRFTSPTGCEVCLFTPVTPTEMIQMM